MSGRSFMPVLLSLAAGLIFMAPPAVLAQAGAEAQQQDPAALYQAAGATPDQLAKIRSMGEQVNNAQQARAQRLRQLVMEMRQMSLQTDPDSNAVLGKQDQINQTQAEMANEHLKLMLAIRKVLTPEQKQRLVQLLQGAGGNGGGAEPAGAGGQ